MTALNLESGNIWIYFEIRSHSIALAGLELRDMPSFASQVLEFKESTTSLAYLGRVCVCVCSHTYACTNAMVQVLGVRKQFAGVCSFLTPPGSRELTELSDLPAMAFPLRNLAGP